MSQNLKKELYKKRQQDRKVENIKTQVWDKEKDWFKIKKKNVNCYKIIKKDKYKKR